MRPIQSAALAVMLLAVLQTGCRSESAQDPCSRATDEYCAERGGCSEFLRAMEMRACAAKARGTARTH